MALAASAVLLCSSAGARATTFYFQFDASGGGPDGTIGTPIVGVGAFATPTTLTPGTYALSSLSYGIFFLFNGFDVFTQNDLLTDPTDVGVTITKFGSGERLVFTEAPGAANPDSGPFGGSADFFNGISILTFEPSAAGGNDLYFQLDAVAANGGNYLATSVPESSTWIMMLAGFAGLGFVGYRRTRPRAVTTAATA